MTALDAAFLARPIAHRALHDRAARRPENSRAAVRAAVAAGYGIEIDIQPSADGVAMVFHDHALDRLTFETGAVCRRTAADLGTLALRDADDGIPRLAEVLGIVAGQVPLLIEIKDQDGALGPNVGDLEAAVARDVNDYSGPLALMSFNPESVAALARLCPDRPRGLVTCAFRPTDWPIPEETCDRLRAIPDLERVGATFISHEFADLDRARVREIRAGGRPVLTWTIRTLEEDAAARYLSDNVTFEGYLPDKIS